MSSSACALSLASLLPSPTLPPPRPIAKPGDPPRQRGQPHPDAGEQLKQVGPWLVRVARHVVAFGLEELPHEVFMDVYSKVFSYSTTLRPHSNLIEATLRPQSSMIEAFNAVLERPLVLMSPRRPGEPPMEHGSRNHAGMQHCELLCLALRQVLESPVQQISLVDADFPSSLLENWSTFSARLRALDSLFAYHIRHFVKRSKDEGMTTFWAPSEDGRKIFGEKVILPLSEKLGAACAALLPAAVADRSSQQLKGLRGVTIMLVDVFSVSTSAGLFTYLDAQSPLPIFLQLLKPLPSLLPAQSDQEAFLSSALFAPALEAQGGKKETDRERGAREQTNKELETWRKKVRRALLFPEEETESKEDQEKNGKQGWEDKMDKAAEARLAALGAKAEKS